ncbi:MAG: tetratricopeptide repeat protein, partial [Acidobacteriota bacterium]
MGGLLLNRSRQAPAEDTPAFGGIAERFRRAGDLDRAITLCRDGLTRFPGQLSARVTLGWALLDKGQYEEARLELEQVLKRAPDNLAAIRGLAELHDREEQSMPSMDGDSGWNQDAKRSDSAVTSAVGASVGAATQPAAPPPPAVAELLDAAATGRVPAAAADLDGTALASAALRTDNSTSSATTGVLAALAGQPLQYHDAALRLGPDLDPAIPAAGEEFFAAP